MAQPPARQDAGPRREPRIGSTDVTMALPGSNEELTVQVSNNTAIEFRSMSDQGIFIEVPARAGLLDNLTA